MKKRIGLTIFFVLFIIYEELIFSYVAFGMIPQNMMYILLFSLPIGLILNFVTGIFGKKVNAVIAYILIAIIEFVFCAQFIYYIIYQSIISFFSAFNGGGQILQFADMIFKTVLDNWIPITAMLVPILLLMSFQIFKIIDFKKSNYKKRIVVILLIVIFQVIPIGILNLIPTNGQLYSPYNLYYKMHAPNLTVQTFGIFTEMRLDLQRMFLGFEEETLTVNSEPESEPEPEIKEYEYNKIEIDFNTLNYATTNSNIKKINEYISSSEATKQNEYTGMFEGKNLIVFVAEGFSSLAIREDLTPNLYKLYNEGFQFDNFYTPIFPVSTADGEYITDTSLIPKEGVWSLSKVQNNYMPYSYANVFERLGYTSQAYHDHTYTYYDRDKYIAGMGYNSYLAKGNGLEKRMNCTRWPNSDYEMIQATTDDYIQDENFISYYMTVSGHLNYTTNGNYIANKNWDEVKSLPYSAKARSYLATQIELDKAIGELIDRLEKAGKLEDTVIAISADHYPYGLTLDEINELSTYTRDNTFEKYHMPFLVWNSKMEKPIKVEKLGSSLDVLPTLLNLFGVKYDSRFLMGTDILSNSDPLVIFSDRSFITDKGRYSSVTKKFTSNEGVAVENEYVDKISTIIYQKYQISKLILENNYYNTLKNYFK